jgi:hypothetical protein
MSDSDEQQMSDTEEQQHEFEVETCSSQCAHTQPQITVKIGSVIFIESDTPKKKKVEDEKKEVKSNRLCRFFNTPNGCNKGAECHFKHDVVHCTNSECNGKKCMFKHPVYEGRYFKAGKATRTARQRVHPYQ